MEVPTSTRHTARFGAFEVDLRSGELRKNGHKIRLQDQPFQVLAMLLEHPGEVVMREDLRQKLWPADTFVDFDDGLNTAIKKLRDALGDSAESPRFIETLPKRGYRFITPVNGAAAASPLPQTADTVAGQAATSATSQRKRTMQLALLGAVVMLGVVAGLRTGPKQPMTLAPGPVRSIAVLPLENLSGDPSQEYFADGITDALTTSLAQISSLRVISRTTAMQYKGKAKPVREIARELNVDAIVEGSVVRSGDRVRINAQLIHASTDRHLWAQSYERDLKDVLTLQNDVVQAITANIRAQLTPRERERLARTRQVNPEAYEAYLKGRASFFKWTSRDVAQAIEYFQHALQKDQLCRGLRRLASFVLGAVLSWLRPSAARHASSRDRGAQGTRAGRRFGRRPQCASRDPVSLQLGLAGRRAGVPAGSCAQPQRCPDLLGVCRFLANREPLSRGHRCRPARR